MAGGVWTSQNKVRPGAYINFESNNISGIQTGIRGIVTFAQELNWGKEDSLIELTMNDLLSGGSLAKVGFISTDNEALLANLALQNAKTLKIYRLNKGGTKASYTGDSLSVEAKYSGTFGNKIAILITQTSDANLFNVQTYADGYLVDTQTVSNIPELVNNDFVNFSGIGAITALSSTLLTGGTNGTAEENYINYFNILKVSKWNTLAVPVNTVAIITSVIDFIENMRINEGKYVQAVIANTSTNNEGIINNVNGVVINETQIDEVKFTVWVAGATAGADITESLTGKIIPNATSIIGLKSNEDIIQGLINGEFLLSLNQDGSIKVEKDINSLHIFSDKGYIFSKNRVIRELDEIGTSIENIWETTYLGKVANNENGRTLFKSSIIDYLTELENKGAIANFDLDNIMVEYGNDIDSIIVSIAVKPIDSMEFLYMTVNINQ